MAHSVHRLLDGHELAIVRGPPLLSRGRSFTGRRRSVLRSSHDGGVARRGWLSAAERVRALEHRGGLDACAVRCRCPFTVHVLVLVNLLLLLLLQRSAHCGRPSAASTRSRRGAVGRTAAARWTGVSACGGCVCAVVWACGSTHTQRARPRTPRLRANLPLSRR